MDHRIRRKTAAVESGKRLRLVRERLHPGTSQQAFAARLGVPLTTYNNWEQGVAFPPPDVLWRLKEITPGLDLAFVYWGQTDGMSVATLRALRA